MIKKIIGSMEDYEDRKADGRIELSKVKASESGDDFLVKMKRWDAETGAEVEPLEYMLRAKDLDLRISEIEGLLNALEIEINRLTVLKDDLIALE